jgi:acyl-CoA synthetase (NDP forming)
VIPAKLRASGFALGGDAGAGGRVVVPEPVVKEWLGSYGVAVPAAVALPGSGHADAPGNDPPDVSPTAPVVLKAYGAGIVHKSELGAVQVGVVASELGAAIAAMRDRLHQQGIVEPSFFAEAQAEPGLELIVGVIDRGFGPMLAVGLGGVFAEVLDDVSLRCAPVSVVEIDAMLDELKGAALLRGARGGDPIDRAAVVALIDAVQQAALALGDELAELECNPVVARPDGAVALDARLLLRDMADATERGARRQRPRTDFGRLFRPRGIAVAGASATKESFGNRFLDAYRAIGWTNGLAALHPTAVEINGVKAFPSLADVPFVVDYVVAAIPASGCAQLVRDAAGVAPFVHVISGGFGESSEAGLALEATLSDAARRSGVRVLGPNCMGTFSPRGRQTFQLGAPTEAGSVSVVSQSGGLAGDIIKLGEGAGLRFANLVTLGNSVDVTPGEMVDWLVDDPDTAVIGLYLEDPRDGAGLVRALRRCAGRTPTVALVGGLSRQGGEAVASHTGSMAGDSRVWTAISASTGLSVVQTLDEFIAVLAALQADVERVSARDDGGGGGVGVAHTLIVGAGGGASVLATDACDRAGLMVTPVGDDIRIDLRSLGYGAGTSVANPIEIPFGPAASLDAFARVLAPILAEQHYDDVLLHFNVQAYFSFSSDGAARLAPVVGAIADLAAQWPQVRFSLVPRNLDCAPPDVAAELLRDARARGLRCFRWLEHAAVAISASQRFDRARRRPASHRDALGNPPSGSGQSENPQSIPHMGEA